MSKLLLLLALLACSPVQAAEPEAAAQPVDHSAEVYHLRFSADVATESVAHATKSIEEANEEHWGILLIELNTEGGEVDSGFELAKAIENSEVPVVCVVDGQTDSMGFYIFQSCPVRLMTKRSRLMVHDAHYMLTGVALTPATAEAYVRKLRVLRKSMNAHWSAKLKITPQVFEARMRANGDWWMNWDEAKEIGAIDDTVSSTKSLFNGLSAAQKLRAKPAPAPAP